MSETATIDEMIRFINESTVAKYTVKKTENPDLFHVHRHPLRAIFYFSLERLEDLYRALGGK